MIWAIPMKVDDKKSSSLRMTADFISMHDHLGGFNGWSLHGQIK
jgi:hypothetical protein